MASLDHNELMVKLAFCCTAYLISHYSLLPMKSCGPDIMKSCEPDISATTWHILKMRLHLQVALSRTLWWFGWLILIPALSQFCFCSPGLWGPIHCWRSHHCHSSPTTSAGEARLGAARCAGGRAGSHPDSTLEGYHPAALLSVESPRGLCEEQHCGTVVSCGPGLPTSYCVPGCGGLCCGS